MVETNNIEIALSKGKLAKLLVFSIIFLGAGLWIAITQPHVGNPVFDNAFVKNIAAYAGIVMGALGIYFFIKKLFDKRPGVIINEQGITDNSGAFSLGFIAWDDIAEVGELKVQASMASKQKFVCIKLKSAEPYIARETSNIKRSILALNLKNLRVNISTNGLNIKHESLLALVQDAYNKYKAPVLYN